MIGEVADPATVRRFVVSQLRRDQQAGDITGEVAVALVAKMITPDLHLLPGFAPAVSSISTTSNYAPWRSDFLVPLLAPATSSR